MLKWMLFACTWNMLIFFPVHVDFIDAQHLLPVSDVEAVVPESFQSSFLSSFLPAIPFSEDSEKSLLGVNNQMLF